MGKDALIKIMNQYVADLMVLYIKLHNLHWLVKGRQFVMLHGLFEEMYDKVTADMDAVAEWLCIEGEIPVASLKEALALSQIEERIDKERIDGTSALEACMSDLDYMCKLTVYVKGVASDAGDSGAEAMMEGLEEYYKKQMWFIRSMLMD